ncbi:tRNA (5-methylaminomethyl-2-thiouridine)(34)-methyltransferase MnmD [Rhizobium skierniewicense]|uniref:tRNA (5-methylaminomethyl-2-thiouridine)(34)-methyltransferase MnmD n=1 Tax=Rhizobium TaxID=379 RepID=UPI001FAE54CE|nr:MULTISPECIES: tRNA (5-methylaminomethyl-2-thiouridine)(34)-methyltransferase MnmD [Rhizobium]MCI9864712.1 tRNA (5-methylaminomethyl-2-thiouridine)(34)-methyltransferase MnmD [Rhizobium skierniewicense]
MTHPDENMPARAGSNMLDWREGDMPYSLAFGDHFYCQTDGRQECSHVSLAGNGLPERWETAQGTFRIGELGFGTALNLCETWRQWKLHRPANAVLHFVSFELYPMSPSELNRALSHWPQLDAERKAFVAQWPQNPEGWIDITLDEQTRLTVFCGDAMQGIIESTDMFDAWYLDGFAPSKNPDMWSLEIMSALFEKTAPGGTFATFAAAGFVRRNLGAAGFTVERRPGFAGKREMLCGVKPAQ